MSSIVESQESGLMHVSIRQVNLTSGRLIFVSWKCSLPLFPSTILNLPRKHFSFIYFFNSRQIMVKLIKGPVSHFSHSGIGWETISIVFLILLFCWNIWSYFNMLGILECTNYSVLITDFSCSFTKFLGGFSYSLTSRSLSLQLICFQGLVSHF